MAIVVAGLVAITLLSPEPTPSPPPAPPGAGTAPAPTSADATGDDLPAAIAPGPTMGPPATRGVPTASVAALVGLLEGDLDYSCADLPEGTVVCDAPGDLSGRTEIRRDGAAVVAVDSSASAEQAATVLAAVARLAVPAADADTAGAWVRRAVAATGPEAPVATTAVAGVPFAVYGDGTAVFLDLG